MQTTEVELNQFTLRVNRNREGNASHEASQTYEHSFRLDDETPMEHMSRVITDFPELRNYLQQASYLTAYDFVDGREVCWSHCFIFNSPNIQCLITPGTLIHIHGSSFEIVKGV